MRKTAAKSVPTTATKTEMCTLLAPLPCALAPVGFALLEADAEAEDAAPEFGDAVAAGRELPLPLPDEGALGLTLGVGRPAKRSVDWKVTRYEQAGSIRYRRDRSEKLQWPRVGDGLAVRGVDTDKVLLLRVAHLEDVVLCLIRAHVVDVDTIKTVVAVAWCIRVLRISCLEARDVTDEVVPLHDLNERVVVIGALMGRPFENTRAPMVLPRRASLWGSSLPPGSSDSRLSISWSRKAITSRCEGADRNCTPVMAPCGMRRVPRPCLVQHATS